MGVVHIPRRFVVPLGLVLILAAGFAAWYALPPRPAAPDPQPLLARSPQTLPVPGPPGEVDRLQAVANALKSIQPGMRRVEVEATIGRPDPKSISPVERTNGQAVYRTRHPAFVTEPLWFAPDVRGHCEAILEYDATRPGHPLIRLSCGPIPPPPPVPIPMGMGTTGMVPM